MARSKRPPPRVTAVLVTALDIRSGTDSQQREDRKCELLNLTLSGLKSTTAATLMVLVLWANPAVAQLAVSDGPVETNTTIIASMVSGISSQQLPAMIAQDTLTAQSLTTAGGAGRFQSQFRYLESLMQTMGNGIASAQASPRLIQAGSISERMRRRRRRRSPTRRSPLTRTQSQLRRRRPPTSAARTRTFRPWKRATRPA